MANWRASSAGLPLASLIAGTALSFACVGEPQTNFGPPGGLSGKELPPGEIVPSEAGGKGDGAMMKKCVFKPPPDAGTSESGMSEEAGSEGGTEEGGMVAEASSSSGGGAPEGGSDSGSSSSDCAVSWTHDIFPNMTAAGLWQCASASCHGGGGVAGPSLSDDPTTSYDALAAYMTQLTTPSLPFILPCSTDPKKSAILCNLSGTSCGFRMPLTTNGAKLLTAKQIDAIKTWIGCGAIDN